ncbi:hypothetical protein N9H39_05985 [Gammaproteobacteria bacterium]|jgi:hypothetical protein|nr:hypothetical protein [Gammaproteobacteria bacterium]
MDKHYYETVDNLEKLNVDRDYILGWIGGYLRNPHREEQRVTEAYTSGYADGESKQTTHADNWKVA